MAADLPVEECTAADQVAGKTLFEQRRLEEPLRTPFYFLRVSTTSANRSTSPFATSSIVHCHVSAVRSCIRARL